MKASEAKEVADKAYASKGDMTALYTAIETAAMKGDCFIWWYKGINALQGKTLEADGYKVKYSTDRNEDIYEIRWD